MPDARLQRTRDAYKAPGVRMRVVATYDVPYRSQKCKHLGSMRYDPPFDGWRCGDCGEIATTSEEIMADRANNP